MFCPYLSMFGRSSDGGAKLFLYPWKTGTRGALYFKMY